MRLFYPGSFDPLHLGHLDLIRRAHAIASELIVGVGHNPSKQSLLSHEHRIACLQEAVAGLPRTTVIGYRGATLEEARRLQATALLRGIRNTADLEFELTMAAIHRSQGLETLFLLTDGRYAHISSSAVRLALSANLPLNELVPPGVARALERRASP